ncbi:MAG: hypothetical protein ACK53L_32905, partial [Pirellulaceae bacterium]
MDIEADEVADLGRWYDQHLDIFGQGRREHPLLVLIDQNRFDPIIAGQQAIDQPTALDDELTAP